MSCLGCKCIFCARNVDLGSEFFTPGEIKSVSDLCYNCDDCESIGNPNLYKRGCPRFKEAVKSIESRTAAARKKIKVIREESK